MSERLVRENHVASENLETARMNIEMAMTAIQRATSAMTVAAGDQTPEEVRLISTLREMATNLTMYQLLLIVAYASTKAKDAE